MSEFIGALSSTFIAYSRLSAEEQSNNSLLNRLQETFGQIADDLSRIDQHRTELEKLSSELEKQLTATGPRFIIYPITTFVKHLNLTIGFDGLEVSKKETVQEPFTYKVKKDKTIIYIPKLFYQNCANSSICQALSVIFEQLRKSDYEFVEVDALTEVPEDKSELAFATRMYVIENGKLQSFTISKASEKKLAKKNNSSPLINSLLVNLRAHVIEIILKASKFERKNQNVWYPYTWQKYVKDTLKNNNQKVITPLEQSLRSKVKDNNMVDLYLFLVKDILQGSLPQQQLRLPWKHIMLPAADLARQMQLKDKKKTYFSLIYNSKDPSNLDQKKEMDYIKPKTLEILTSATIQEKQAIVEIYKSINGEVVPQEFEDLLDEEENPGESLSEAQFQLKQLEKQAEQLTCVLQEYGQAISSQQLLTIGFINKQFESLQQNFQPFKQFMLHKLQKDIEELASLYQQNEVSKAALFIPGLLKKFQVNLLEEVKCAQLTVMDIQNSKVKEPEQINSVSLKKEKQQKQPRDFWANPTFEQIKNSIKTIENSYKKVHEQQANKFKFVQNIVNKRLDLLEEKDKKRKDAFKVLQKKLESTKSQGTINQKSRDIYGLQKETAASGQIYSFTAIVLPALSQILRKPVTFEEYSTNEQVRDSLVRKLVKLGLVLTADQIRLESALIKF